MPNAWVSSVSSQAVIGVDAFGLPAEWETLQKLAHRNSLLLVDDSCEALGAEILKLCVEVGGCLTGEHGVGIEKRDLMNVQFAPEDLEAQMRVKDVFDPKWLLNPAKVFPIDASRSRRQRNAPREAAE